MRKPTPSEIRLLAVFAFLLFALANIFVIKAYSTMRSGLVDRLTQLRQAVAEYTALVEEQPYWEARQVWMQKHPLPPHQGRESDSLFVEEMHQSLTKSGLSIDSQQLKDSFRDGELVDSQLELTVKGRLEQVIRWLNEIQKPGSHLVVRSFTLRKLDEGDSMMMRIRLAKIFRIQTAMQSP